MAEVASADVSTRFHADGFGEAWCGLFEEVTSQLGESPPRTWEDFELALPFQRRKGFRRAYGLFPRAFKENIRMMLENLRAGVT
jgi:hypothetical protein